MEHPALHQLYYPSMECVTIKYVPSTNFHRVISNSAYSGMCMYKISQQKQHWIIAKSQDLLRISQHKRHYHRAHRMISTSSFKNILLAFISPNFYRIGKREGQVTICDKQLSFPQMCARGQLALLVKSEDTRFLQNKVTYGGPIPTPNAYPAFSCAAFIFFFPKSFFL